MRTFATLLAALLLFSGCTDDPKPKEPKKTSTPKPTAKAPSMPSEATKGTDEGAIAFVKHYIDVFNYASNTGDVRELKSLSDPKCEGCSSYIDLYEKTYQDGGFYRNSDWTMSKPKAELQGQTVVVFANISAPAGTYRLTRTSGEKPGDVENFDAAFVPAWQDGSWLMKSAGKQAN